MGYENVKIWPNGVATIIKSFEIWTCVHIIHALGGQVSQVYSQVHAMCKKRMLINTTGRLPQALQFRTRRKRWDFWWLALNGQMVKNLHWVPCRCNIDQSEPWSNVVAHWHKLKTTVACTCNSVGSGLYIPHTHIEYCTPRFQQGRLLHRVTWRMTWKQQCQHQNSS